ncbi:MAG TPA: hypothetical protein VEK15_23540 [Vicinamibacteria bacterium]|nr:hypothetical protein [Vicinamibacteria bacterium]
MKHETLFRYQEISGNESREEDRSAPGGLSRRNRYSYGIPELMMAVALFDDIFQSVGWAQAEDENVDPPKAALSEQYTPFPKPFPLDIGADMDEWGGKGKGAGPFHA